jgi:hypothetical protein
MYRTPYKPDLCNPSAYVHAHEYMHVALHTGLLYNLGKSSAAGAVVAAFLGGATASELELYTRHFPVPRQQQRRPFDFPYAWYNTCNPTTRVNNMCLTLPEAVEGWYE